LKRRPAFEIEEDSLSGADMDLHRAHGVLDKPYWRRIFVCIISASNPSLDRMVKLLSRSFLFEEFSGISLADNMNAMRFSAKYVSAFEKW
jgi:hypothetical protein